MYVRCLLLGAIFVSMLVLSPAAMAEEDDTGNATPTVRDGDNSMADGYTSIGMAAAAAFTASISILALALPWGKSVRRPLARQRNIPNC